MKVVYLLGSLNRGGTETLMLDVFRHAPSSGLDAVCVYRKGGVCEEDFRQSGVAMHLIPTNKNMLLYILRLRRFLLQEGAVIVHAMQSIDALYAQLASIGTSIKVVLTTHCFDFDLSRSIRLLDRIALKTTDLNIYVSQFQLDYYRMKYHLDNKKQQVNYNGISFSKLDKVNLRSDVRKEFHIPADVMLLGMVGNFNSGRDPMTVCRFLEQLHSTGIDFRFLFVGNRVRGQETVYDECVEYCQVRQLDKKVIFTGGRNDVPTLLTQLDAFIYSTAHDTFGIAVVEAMATGIPVFVNDWGVMQEVSENGHLAKLYKTSDENDLLRVFQEHLREPEQQVSREQRMQEVRNRFGIVRHISTLQSCYYQLINK